MIDPIKIRQDFPMYENHPNMAYLDTCATCIKPKCVIDAMNEYYFNYGVNIHRGVYSLSYIASQKYDDTKKVVAKFLNCKPSEVIYTKGVTSSLNIISQILLDKLNEGDEVITCQLEHHSSVLPWMINCQKKNAKLKYIPLTEDGKVTVENFEKTISEKTKFVCLTMVSNVMGYKLPIKEIIEISHKYNAICIIDAAQACGHFKIDVKELDCDFLAFSAHKMLGPTGIGVLYGKKALLNSLNPLEYGGDMNDEVGLDFVTVKEAPERYEAGTPVIAEAFGLKRAIEYITSIGFDQINEYEKYLHKYCLDKLSELEDVIIYNKDSDIGIVSFNIKGVHPHDAATFYDEDEICLRAGHHCAQLVTKFLGVDGTLRASFYIYNTTSDVDRFVEMTKNVIEFFKKFN